MENNWIDKYILRVREELKLEKTSPMGNKMVTVHVYDLLEESGLGKVEFFEKLFFLNKCIDEKIVLYLK